MVVDHAGLLVSEGQVRMMHGGYAAQAILEPAQSVI